MTSVLRGNSLALIARDDNEKSGVAGADAARSDVEPTARRRDYYWLVWRTAGKKARDRVVPSTTTGLVMAVLALLWRAPCGPVLSGSRRCR